MSLKFFLDKQLIMHFIVIATSYANNHIFFTYNEKCDLFSDYNLTF